MVLLLFQKSFNSKEHIRSYCFLLLVKCIIHPTNTLIFHAQHSRLESILLPASLTKVVHIWNSGIIPTHEPVQGEGHVRDPPRSIVSLSHCRLHHLLIRHLFPFISDCAKKTHRAKTGAALKIQKVFPLGRSSGVGVQPVSNTTQKHLNAKKTLCGAELELSALFR